MVSVTVEHDRRNFVSYKKVKVLGILIYKRTEGRVKYDS